MLNLALPTSKHYGDYSVSLCITYFLGRGYQILLPMGDRGDYDLVVEKDSTFECIQCKWTTHLRKPQGYPIVSLRVAGSAKKENKVVKTSVHRYTPDSFDFLWVTSPESCYLIPSSVIYQKVKSKAVLEITPKWDVYRVPIVVPHPSGETTVQRASPRLTESDKIMIRRLRKDGKSQQDIAEILGVTRSCIEKFILRNPSTTSVSSRPSGLGRDKLAALAVSG